MISNNLASPSEGIVFHPVPTRQDLGDRRMRAWYRAVQLLQDSALGFAMSRSSTFTVTVRTAGFPCMQLRGGMRLLVRDMPEGSMG